MRAPSNQHLNGVAFGPSPLAHTNINISNNTTGTAPATTGSAQSNATPQLVKVLHPECEHRSHFTIAPPVVESTPQSTTTTTVITISTTTTRATEPPLKAGEDAKSEDDSTSDDNLKDKDNIKDEDEDSNSGLSSELSSILSQRSSEEESEANTDIRQEQQNKPMFLCLHCENPRPMSMASMSTCVFCVNEWRWCDKCDRHRPKAEFKWKGEEHDECSGCYFSL